MADSAVGSDNITQPRDADFLMPQAIAESLDCCEWATFLHSISNELHQDNDADHQTFSRG